MIRYKILCTFFNGLRDFETLVISPPYIFNKVSK